MSSNSFAEPIRSYVGLSTGVVLPNSSSLNDVNGTTSDVSYNPGLSVSGFVGHELGMGLRLEGEVNYNRTDLDKINTAGNIHKLNAELWSIGLFANTYYDFIISNAFKPYIGAGLGFKSVNMSGATVGDARLWDSDRDTVFAYQVGFGYSAKMTRDMAFDMGYRYQGTEKFRIDRMTSDFSSHNIVFGIRYYH
jgi:opacity protein-like surface antigen